MIIIAGATASGKTALAEKICLSLGGEIVSADSMQIYKGMDIGTAKDVAPPVPQHLVDVTTPDKPLTVVDYRRLAAAKIREISARGKLPVVVGGTGLYITSLLYGMEYGGDFQVDSDLKSQIEREYAESGGAALHLQLDKLDPVSAAKIHPNNKQRLLRALYVARASGKAPSAQKAALDPVEPFRLFIISYPRAALYERIVFRVKKMLEEGLEKEVEALIGKGFGFGLQSMQGIGYKEWKSYFEGAATLAETEALIIKNTRAYAKRQDTWFNNQYKDISDVLDGTLGAETLAPLLIKELEKGYYGKEKTV